MYYQNYEDYMRSVLGYPLLKDNYTYENLNYYYEEDSNRDSILNQEDMENVYPNIYKKINPILCKECDNFNDKITKEIVENIVEKIYSAIEQDNDINMENNRTLDKDMDSKIVQNRNIDNNKSIQSNVRERLQNINRNNLNENNLRGIELEKENRQTRLNNPLLRDLIRILVLNRLFRRPGNIGPRPPFLPERPIYKPMPPRPEINYPINSRPPMPRQDRFNDFLR